MLNPTSGTPYLLAIMFFLLCGSSSQALRFDPVPAHTERIQTTELTNERVPRERIKSMSKADRKKWARKVKRFFKKKGRIIKKQQNKVGVYLALELIGYILFGVIAIWLTLGFYAAITGSIVWFIVLAIALGLLATAIWATIKRRELIMMNPNILQEKRNQRRQRFQLNNDLDKEAYIEHIQLQKKRRLFLGLWLGTLLAVILCLAIGLPMFFSTIGAVLVLTALVLTPVNITFFVLFLVFAAQK